MPEVLTGLRLGEALVAEYADGSGLGPDLGPRPHLHPVRTLGGVPVSAVRPQDHPWHLAVSIAVQDVGGWNLWGGPTYVRGQGYVRRDDHGRIEHAGFAERTATGFTEDLRWLSGAGERLLSERRVVRAARVAHGWELALQTTLVNPGERTLHLGSPATNGRTGAGYGGFFWRLPEVRRPRVRTAEAEGEEAVHGSTSRWIAFGEGEEFTLVLTADDPVTAADPWFVRVADYPGVGSQLAAVEPVPVPAGGELRRSFRVLIADGALADRTITSWAGRS